MMYVSETVQALATVLTARAQTLVLAESCTGGGIAAACTSLAGSSRWFERGWVTYSNAAKQQELGVLADTLANHGAVSAACVREMVAGALVHSPADWALAVSGIAGPDGGSADKPIGTVWFARACRAGAPDAVCQHFAGDRAAIQAQAVAFALRWLREAVETADSQAFG